MIATEKRHAPTASASTAYKERQVLQLLKDYRAWRTPGGGAMPAEDSHLRSATYGPAGYTPSGQGFPVEGRRLLADTYRDLETCIRILREHREELWLPLTRAYLGESADPSVITDVRAKRDHVDKEVRDLRARQKKLARLGKKPDETIPGRIRDYERTRKDIDSILKTHDEAVLTLAMMLWDRDLYVDFPKPMSIRQAERMEDRYAQVASEYTRFLNSGMKKTRAKEATGELYNISVRHVERILAARQ